MLCGTYKNKNTFLVWYIGLTFWFAFRHVYWTDWGLGRIETCRYDGTERKQILQYGTETWLNGLTLDVLGKPCCLFILQTFELENLQYMYIIGFITSLCFLRSLGYYCTLFAIIWYHSFFSFLDSTSEQEMFWTDASVSSVMWASMSGDNQGQLITGAITVSNRNNTMATVAYYGITADDTSLYFTDWRAGWVLRCTGSFLRHSVAALCW